LSGTLKVIWSFAKRVGYSMFGTRTEVILDYWLSCVLELFGKNADKFLLFNVVQVFR